MPRRPEGRRTGALAALTLVATALVLAGTVEGAGDSLARTAARAWHGVFGDRPQPAAEQHQRVLVVLSSPSLADRMAAAEEQPSAEQQRQWTAEAEGAQQLVLAGLRDRDVKVVRDQVFTRTFNGFSAVVDPRALAELERAHDVAGVYPVRTVYPAAPTAETVVGGGFQPEGGRGTQVALPGFDGAGVTIALLDTGVDRRHAYLQGRVSRGFDVVDGDADVSPEPKPGEPGVVEAHATRMAGLLVGHDGPSGLQGVAPDARILPIRVLGWQQTADGSWAVLGRGDLLLAGLERAVDPDGDGDVEDAVQIALVGGVQPYAAFASSPEARATAGATRLGTLVVAPVGNDGRPGPGFGTVAAPAAAAEALAVGTLDARREVFEADAELRVGSDTVLDDPVRLLGGAPPQGALRFEVAAVAGPTLAQADRPAEAAAAGDVLADFFDTNGVSLVAGKAVVVQADQGAVERRVRNAAEAGAAAVLVSGTNLPAGALDLEDGVTVPVLAVPADAGQAALAGGASLDLSGVRVLPNTGLMDVVAFSSGGVAFDGRVKPDLVAPGVGLVTADAGGQGFATVTGSSAAAAVVAGAAALVAQARPDLRASDLKSALVGSGGRLLRSGLALPVTAQGGGLVDPTHAATAEIAVQPATVAFGRAQGADWSTTATLSVRNVSSRPLTMSFGLVPDAGAAELAFSADPAGLTLGPGEARDVAIGVSANGVDPQAGAGGVIVVSAEGAQPVRVPWAVARRQADAAPLVGEVQLSHHEFSPSDRAPVVLAFRAGRVDPAADGEMIEPVGLLEVELWSADGRKLGVLARLRDVLPGRYAYGLTGRGPHGKILPAGTYVLRLRAHPVDGDDGTSPSTAEAVFTIVP
ncbi:MAG TPA: S8 family serine peptidase [Gaiellaceae bacterium]|nr:S8 family serine peptidase [Gaiellaceae bacterium]